MNDSFFPFQWNDITRYCAPLTGLQNRIDVTDVESRGSPLGFSPCHIDYILARCRRKTGHLVVDDVDVARERQWQGRGRRTMGEKSDWQGLVVSAERYVAIGHTWGCRLPIGKHRCVHRDSAPWSLINARIRGGRGPFTRCIDGTRASGALWSTPGFRE